MENFIFSSIPIEISEFANHKEATFLISVLDEYNLNNVLIEKAEGEKYHKTIVGYPILAYLKYDKDGKPDDFGGHELRAKYNSETKEIEYYFATFPIGSVTDSYIEKREVDGYEGEKDCILIKTKLWKSRFPEYFKVFDKLWNNGSLASSWEISSSETKKTTKGKILKVFEFIGNTCLGKYVTPAVTGAGVLNVASEDEVNYELSNAFVKDIQTLDLNNKISNSDDESDNDINNENDLDKEDKLMSNQASEEIKELSGLTDNDLYSKLRKAINATDKNKYYYISRIYPYDMKCIAYEWDAESQDSHVEFLYTVNSDETISITSQKDVVMMFVPKSDYTAQISELETKVSELETKVTELSTDITTKTDALVKASEEVENLKSEISNLQPYKEEADKLAQIEAEKVLSEKKEALKKLALKGGFISETEINEDEIVKSAIESLDESTIKNIIADRFMKKLDEQSSTDTDTNENNSTDTSNSNVETSTTDTKVETASANINIDEESMDFKAVMSAYLKK